jgi:hypothetical protein
LPPNAPAEVNVVYVSPFANAVPRNRTVANAIPLYFMLFSSKDDFCCVAESNGPHFFAPYTARKSDEKVR